MISIIIPAFNEEKFIRDTLISIQNQTFQDFECIVVDDGSQDSTARIVRDIQKEDKRFHLENPGKLGKNGAINFGYRRAKAEWITLFSADDIMPASALKDLYQKTVTYDPYSEKVYIGALVHSFSQDDRYKHEDNILIAPPNIDGLFGNSIGLFSKALAEECFPIPTIYPNEDTWLRLCLRYFSDVRLQTDVVLFNYRIHEDNSYDHNSSFQDFSIAYNKRRVAIWDFAEQYKERLTSDTFKRLISLRSLEEQRFRGHVIGVLMCKDVSKRERFKALMQSTPHLFYIKKKLSRLYMGRVRA